MLSILQSSTQVGISQTGVDKTNRAGTTADLASPKNTIAEQKKDTQALIGKTPSTDISQLLYQARQQKVEAKPRLELSLLQTQSASGSFNTLDAQNASKANSKEASAPGGTSTITDAINPSEIASATANQPQVAITESPKIESTNTAADPNAISSQIEINTSYTFEPYKVGEEQLPSYVYDDELNIDGAGRAPTAIFLSDQG